MTAHASHIVLLLVPTGVAEGERHVAQQQFMASQIPTCRLAVYPRVGHGSNILHPQWCVQQIREFLGQLASG